MNPGDLVRLKKECVSGLRSYRAGEMGIIVGEVWHEEHGIFLMEVMMHDNSKELFHKVLLEVINGS